MPSMLMLRRRLRSVRSTRQITRAMELVAAAKMKRAVDGVLSSRPYTQNLFELLRRLAPLLPSPTHPLLRVSPVRHTTVVVFSSDRGLCGGFNSALTVHAIKAIAEIKGEFSNSRVSVITIGKKARSALRNMISADFPRPSRQAHVADIAALRHLVVEAFTKEETDRVIVVTTDFASALVQRPRTLQLLPLPSLTVLAAQLERGDIGRTTSTKEPPTPSELPEDNALFEPSREAVLDRLLPRAVELLLYQALLESIASEHAARRLAMKSATDAAKDIIDDLLLTTNQTRQATVTREMTEITTAINAMN